MDCPPLAPCGRSPREISRRRNNAPTAGDDAGAVRLARPSSIASRRLPAQSIGVRPPSTGPISPIPSSATVERRATSMPVPSSPGRAASERAGSTGGGAARSPDGKNTPGAAGSKTSCGKDAGAGSMLSAGGRSDLGPCDRTSGDCSGSSNCWVKLGGAASDAAGTGTGSRAVCATAYPPITPDSMTTRPSVLACRATSPRATESVSKGVIRQSHFHRRHSWFQVGPHDDERTQSGAEKNKKNQENAQCGHGLTESPYQR